MKTIYTLALLVTLALTQANAQQPFVKSYVERTHISPKIGTQLGYEFKHDFEVGIFYQKETKAFSNDETAKPGIYEQEFLGMFFSGPLVTREKYDLKINVRTGAVNKTLFSITPSLIAGYKVFKAVELQAGFGIKSFNVTTQAGIRINLSK
jgi:hypothetical protein